LVAPVSQSRDRWSRPSIERSPAVIVLNTEFVPGKRVVEVKGLVQGNTVRAKHVGRDIAAGFKNIFGGELKGYTELLIESRREATGRMIAQAQQLGANAVVNVRFATSSITAGAAELYVYGTAVVIEDEPPTVQ
jgi:uncharacterized protein YbjQ (UPF0145 family)